VIKLLFRIVYTQVFYSTLLNSLFPNLAARVKYHRAAPHTADLGIRKDFANYKDEALEIYPTIVYACTLYSCILTSLVILVVWESNDRH